MRKILREIGKYRALLLGALLCLIVAAGSELLLPSLLSNIINFGALQGDSAYILRTGAIMLLLCVLSVCASVGAEFFSSRFATGFARSVRSRVFSRVERFSMADYDRFGTASLITRTTNDVVQLQNYLNAFVRIIVRSPVMAVGGIILAWGKSSELSRPVMVSMPVIVVAILLIARIVMPLSDTLQLRIDRVNLVLREKMSGIRVMRAFGTEDYEEQRFEQVNRDLTNTFLKLLRTMTLLMPILMLVMNLTSIAIVWYGGRQVALNEGLMAGDIIAVIQYVMQIMFALVLVSMVFIMYPRAAASARRINEVLEQKPSIRDGADTVGETQRLATVEFCDVSFYFEHAENPAVSHISFAAHPGEVTAIIGSTGSGKTALLNLIPRFHDVTEGRVLVDGVDVRNYRQSDLREKIGYVPQRALLFSGTIAENIRYGNPDASDEQVHEAAQVAQALPFIEDKPQGFSEPVAQGGSNLSGGQKQRLSIARAIVRNPEIYLFDDSFSALDYATDARLRAALAQKTGDATVIIVAQRVSTVISADRIIVLDNGSMAGMGRHDELMKTCDVYREIVLSQYSDEEAGI